MKIKLLIAPISIALCIILLIWFIYPSYSNPQTGDGILQKYQKLKEKKESIRDIDARSGNANALSIELTSNLKNKYIVFNYIPETIKEEEHINSLNKLALDNGLSVYNLSVVEKKAAIDTANSGQATGITPDSGVLENASSLPALKYATANFSVIGGYAGIKSLLENMYGLKRFNQVVFLDIKTLLKDDGTASGSLQADIVVDFNYLKKGNLVSDADVKNEVFLSDKFDNSVINKLETGKNKDISKVGIDLAGKADPFTP